MPDDFAKASPAAQTPMKSSVRSLTKAFRLLEAIAVSEMEMTLSELAIIAALDPGTTHRMLNTLVDLGYIERLEGKRFGLTLKVLDLGFRAIGHREMRTIARPILRSLVGDVSEAASLGVLSGSDVLYIERMRAGVTRLGVDIRIGTLVPATNSVIGWALLAFLPKDELSRVPILESGQSGVSAPPLSEIRKQLAAIRKQGYALSPSRISNGLVVLAVPVLDEDGFPLAAISVAAPSIRIGMDELRSRALEAVKNAAKQIARGLEAAGGTVAG